MPTPPKRKTMPDPDDFIDFDEAGAVDRPAEDRPAPTWFPQSRRASPTEELADRYRASRPEPLHEPARLRDYVAANDARPRLQRRAAAEAPVERRTRPEAEKAPRPAMRAPAYVAAGFAAALAGGLIGYAATKQDAIGSKLSGMLAALSAAAPKAAPEGQQASTGKAAPGATAAVPNQSTFAKKPIATATLDVADISGGLNSMIPMMLHAEPANPGEDLILKISGLPQSAYLTAGRREGSAGWQLSASEAHNVNLVVPQAGEPSYDVAIAAFETKTGELAAPIKQIKVAIDDGITVAPANTVADTVTVKSTAPTPTPDSAKADPAVTAPADNTAAATRSDNTAVAATAIPQPQEDTAATGASDEAQGLLAKGDILLKSGDMEMARQFYERAFAKGSVAAALGAGRTFDPVVYREMNVQGLKPDPVRAMEWYMRASAAGNAEAAVAIAALKQAAQTP